jgi:2-keto-4-pentenoate hydratase
MGWTSVRNCRAKAAPLGSTMTGSSNGAAGTSPHGFAHQPDPGRPASPVRAVAPDDLPPLQTSWQYLDALLVGPGRSDHLDPIGGAEPTWIADEALLLASAQRTCTPIERLTNRRTGVTLDDAYQVQRAGCARQLAAGARVAGHKVGLTSAAMRAQMGIDEPDSGILLDTMVIPSGGVVTLSDLVSPRIEAEFAVRLGQDLSGPAVDLHQVRQAVAEVMLALEVIDTRYRGWQLTLADSVADNAACARVVVGPAIPLGALDLRAELLAVSVDGGQVAAGEGREILGDPLNSLVWLTRQLAAFGTGLRAGDLVLAGAVHASFPLVHGTQVRASSAHLPPVNVRIR